MNFLKKLLGKKPTVYVVSGLPRSGTSMMMKMLEAGGFETLTDGIREANVDNPKGYYEFERVKKLPEGDTAWLDDAAGKGVKIISALLLHLPTGYRYRVLFMRRKMPEILASQKKMLVRRGAAPDKISDTEMAAHFTAHLKQVYEWLDGQRHVAYLDVDYNALLVAPEPELHKVAAFLDCPLDIERMATVVDPALYRQRQ